ncbi:MAG: iron ABC transporter permease [Candidatus Methanoplasma sp.]|jgi:iron complex transport system permease protein/cobaltochelatase CobN|nr:iron ABC transporter permease [Candidatus Methanoplasma sp.]
MVTSSVTSVSSEYRKYKRRGIIVTACIVAATFLVIMISISISQYPVGFTEAYKIMVGHINGADPQTYADRLKDHIIWDMNLPRAIGGVMAGAILAIGGAVMQNMIKNPLADPYTTGISSGALFGITVYIVAGVSVIPFASEGISQIANAFVFALIPAFVILFLSAFRKTSPTMMVLIGIGVMYMFSASTSLLKFMADPNDLAEIYTWSIGSIGKITWDNIPVLFVSMVFILASMLIMSKSINVLSSGDNASLSLGINPTRLRMVCLIIISITTATAVCFTGTIGFVGLVAPHIARMFVGSNIRALVPCSAAIGAFMLIAADCIARNAGTTGLPVGVITALIGSPLFLYFLVRQKKNSW